MKIHGSHCSRVGGVKVEALRGEKRSRGEMEKKEQYTQGRDAADHDRACHGREENAADASETQQQASNCLQKVIQWLGGYLYSCRGMVGCL